MAGSTISTSIYAPVEIGTGTYKSPLTITSSGLIDPTNAGYGDTGIYLPNSATVATIINHGRVYGAIGGYNNELGGNGGIAIVLDSANFTSNTGVIAGGGGDSGSASEDGGVGGNGGNGVDVLAFSTLSNSSTGFIGGGFGGYAYNAAPNNMFYGRPGFGGTGVYLQTGSTFTNAGLVTGGGGGNAAQPLSYYTNGGNAVTDLTEANITNSGTLVGGTGGVKGAATAVPTGLQGGQGVSMDDLGHLSNSGAIIGGAGGGGSVVFGGEGNEAVFLNEATASNTGRITGGAGASGSGSGGSGGLGVAVYSFASLSNSKGTITGGAGGAGTAYSGGNGASGVIVSSYGTVNNTGHISGGAGGGAGVAATTTPGGGGGIGVYLDSGKLTNSGTITGGAGGAESSSTTYSTQFAGAGGIGVSTGSDNGYLGRASIINYGVIRGGNGGNIGGDGGAAGSGGAGISISEASFSNHGTIVGGIGGQTGQAAYAYGYGGLGGAGVVVGAGGTVNNIGTIIGGAGGSNIYVGTTGGAGVLIAGGTFIDTGKVIGGAGGFSQGPGSAGYAVEFSGSTAGTLVAAPGASFTGGITGAYNVANVIELTGSSTTRFAGLGVSVTGINTISFASGAERTIEGTNYGVSANIRGFNVNDTIVIDSFTANLTATSADPGPYIELFGSTSSIAYIDINRATAKELLVTDAFGKTTITAVAPGTARVLSSGMGEFAGPGANATGTTIKAGGFEEVANGGTATSTTLAGGELLLKIGASAKTGIAFSTITGGTLVINSATLPTATITGFIAGDTIDLAGIKYNPNDKVTVGTAGTVTISTPGISYKLDIAGATVGETDFKFAAGSLLTKTTSKAALTFISTPELTTSGTSAPHLAGADIFLAYAQHHLAVESSSIGPTRFEPTPAAAGILASGFHDHLELHLLPNLHSSV